MQLEKMLQQHLHAAPKFTAIADRHLSQVLHQTVAIELLQPAAAQRLDLPRDPGVFVGFIQRPIGRLIKPPCPWVSLLTAA